MYDIERMIYTRIMAEMPSSIKSKYSDLNFTTSDKGLDEAKFPTVYVHLISSMETQTDLEADRINEVLATFQVEVYGTSQNMAHEVMTEVCKTMKSLLFFVTTMPINANTDSAYRQIARFRRSIAHDDTI